MTSASSKLVTWGMVAAERTICSAIVRRMREIRSRRTGPQASWPGSPRRHGDCETAGGGRGPPAAAAAAAAA